MGCHDSPCSDNNPQHPVRITKGFWIGQTEVTQAAYERVMKRQSPSYFKGPDLPVEKVSWNEAKGYCKAVGMGLPTEAQWEYAARAGNPNERYGEIDKIAVHAADQTARVASKWWNAWGLYDMPGNVWEWTKDWYDRNYYKSSPPDDPPGPPGPTDERKVVRGGPCMSHPGLVRISDRGGSKPTLRYDDVGFRCAGNLR